MSVVSLKVSIGSQVFRLTIRFKFRVELTGVTSKASRMIHSDSASYCREVSDSFSALISGSCLYWAGFAEEGGRNLEFKFSVCQFESEVMLEV